MDGDLAELINDVDKWDVADEQLERREPCMAMPAVETGGSHSDGLSTLQEKL
jgi:hypothetical protein